QHQKKPLQVGLTLGDPGGIGPNLVLHALMHRHFRKRVKFTVFGSESMLKNRINTLPEEAQVYAKKALSHHHIIGNETKITEQFTAGKASKEGGIQSLQSLDNALEHFASNAYDVLVTAPLDKQSVSEASDSIFTGQTGYIQSYANAEDSLMMMVSDVMKIALVTEHLSLAQVPEAITKDLITRKTILLHKALVEDFNCPTQKIALLALNPHNGDRGLLGSEEREIIIPSIQAIRSMISTVFGPYAADGFFGLHQYKSFDATLAMYHDQGLIPFKATNFDGVNFTAGLPIIRTSPDHGPAYDKVGQSAIDYSSFVQAIYTAIDIHSNRTTFEKVAKTALRPKSDT
ncbi:MAG: 4-hydroxythreonine-4-phosphate dehydrogenase PdxA, partial [Bacteroidota bacterium]|nr:4-hydroxythreonine-4-phosphate dehydrogenase PdxA [Bacteroidota bacterium]